MATHLALEEQEQLDQLKAFWKRYGNLLTWAVTLVALGFVAWNGWNWWQRDQAAKAGAMFDQLERAAQSGDAPQAGRVFQDLRDRYPGTAFAEQGGLVAAKIAFDQGKPDGALAALAWVGSNATETEYRTIARLRAAGILLDQKKYDDALKQLADASAPEFAALVLDRRGDVLRAQDKLDDARAAYQQAWQAMDAKVDYRRLIEAKLNALGVSPSAAATSVSASGASK